MIFIFPFQNLYLHNNFCQKIVFVFNNTENRSNFRRFFAFLPPPPPNIPENQTFEEMKKSMKILSFYTYHKWQSHDVLRYGTWRAEFIAILDCFLLFYPPPPPNNSENSKFWKKEKKHMEIWSFYTCGPSINDNHMMYGS